MVQDTESTFYIAIKKFLGEINPLLFFYLSPVPVYLMSNALHFILIAQNKFLNLINCELNIFILFI
jgi:hypothetical protein